VRYDNRVRPRAARLLGQAHKAWEKMLDSLAWSRVEIHDVASDVPSLMQDYGLQSYDAVHAATLVASEATDFVTRDGGFAVLPPAVATLHTTQVRLAGTRARRHPCGLLSTRDDQPEARYRTPLVPSATALTVQRDVQS
jgi:hypothetical protein